MPPMGRILSLSALLHVSAATPFLTAPLGLPAAEAHGEEPVGPNVELANRTHPGRGLEFATVPGRMTYSGSTGVNIDGGYAYGDPRRYTRGWALHNGLGDPTQCDALCKAQPECQSPGNTCTSQAYQAPDRCYCSYASTPTSEECAIGCHGDPNCGDKSCTLSNARLACPTVVDRSNWKGGDTWSDTFAVTQQGAKVTVVRTDSAVGGWGMNLRFDCGPNQVIPNAPGVGGWGGTCVCPDGAEYPAGDNGDYCASLACEGGTMKNNQCNRRDGAWSRQKVICAPPTVAATPKAPPCGTNEHVSNGRCVTCPPGTTNQGGDDPSGGKDTGCECASTVTLGSGWSIGAGCKGLDVLDPQTPRIEYEAAANGQNLDWRV